MNIPAKHPDAENPLLSSVATALDRLGARVKVAHSGENLVRRLPGQIARLIGGLTPRTQARGSSAPIGPCVSRGEPHGGSNGQLCAGESAVLGTYSGPPVVEVEVEGVANLLHEFCHVLLSGRLDDDHGIDYGAIPFDLSSPSGRVVLWEELACCVTSCAYISRPRAGEGEREAALRVDDWFAEQVEIQPIFYGMQNDTAGFWRRVDALCGGPGDPAGEVVDLAYARIEQVLAWVDAPGWVRSPAHRLTLRQLLDRRFGRVASVPHVAVGTETRSH